MMPLVELLAAVVICMMLHVGLLALLAMYLGVSVRSVTCGIGPTIYARGRLQIKALPISGHVTVKDSRSESLSASECANAFDHQPVWKQVVIPLAGGFSLLLVSVPVLGIQGLTSFGRAFGQVFEGAFAPFTTAQGYLQAGILFTENHAFPVVLALVASKVAALNLLPFGAFNGGQALMNLFRWGRLKLRWEDAVTRWGILLGLILLVGWVLALGFLVIGRHAI